MKAIRSVIPLVLALAVFPAASTSADKIDHLFLGESAPLWSPVSSYYMPSCYLGNCDFDEQAGLDVSCEGRCSPDNYINCTEQPGCADGCAGGTHGVPDSGGCYPRY